MAGTSIIAKTGDIARSGREVEERRCDYVCVLILVDTTAPASLVAPVRDAFVPRLPTSDVRVFAADADIDLLAPPTPDVCVAILGRDTTSIKEDVCELAAAGIPVALVVESALDAPRLPLGETAARRVSVLSATNAAVLTERLAEWLIGASSKSIALAANFPFCRDAKVRELTNSFAKENAMGSVKLGPGGEIPSMAVNQARLALAIAAINGQPLALGRIPEVLSAVGAGFGSHMLAEKGFGKIPVVGKAFEAGLGYLGTQATGRSLQRRFDKREQKEAIQRGEIAPPVRSEQPTMARRAVESMRKRASRRRGSAVASTSGTEVRLLTDGEDAGSLVYE